MKAPSQIRLIFPLSDAAFAALQWFVLEHPDKQYAFVRDSEREARPHLPIIIPLAIWRPGECPHVDAEHDSAVGPLYARRLRDFILRELRAPLYLADDFRRLAAELDAIATDAENLGQRD